MSVTRFLLSLDSRKFPFRARTVERNVLISASGFQGMGVQDQQNTLPSPGWLENYWPLAIGQQAAIVAEYGAMQDLPPEVVAQFGASRVQAYRIAQTGAGASLAVVTATQVWAYSVNGWVKLRDSAVDSQTSIAILKGDTYIHQSGNPLYKIKAPSNTVVPFTEVELAPTTGVVFSEMVSMCAAISYLVATDGVSVYWSAPLDPTQWTPDQPGDQFGAGATKILAVSGEIRFLLSAVDGFYVFTDANAIYARYSGDAENPWIFSEVSNSAGSFQHWAVSTSSNLNSAFLWGDNGLCTISAQQCTYGFPDVTDFLSGSIFESFNTTTNSVETTTNATLDFQLAFLGGRFLTISYGLIEEVRKYILVFDSLLNQWFRIAVDHVSVLDIRQDATDQGIIFDNWLDTFDNSLYTFSEMGGASAASDVKATTLGIICADGKIKRLSPVDIHTIDPQLQDFATLSFEVLPAVLHWADLKASRAKEITLSEVTCFYTYPAFPEDGDPDTENVQYSTSTTAIQASSQEDPTIRTFLLSHAHSNEEFYVERVLGTRLALTVKNTSSLQGLEVGVIAAGTRRI